MKNKSKGFTLIELLAVVIILGILMTVGGVAITRIVENTRKDTFVNTAQEYAEAVRTQWNSDMLFVGLKDDLPSNVLAGNYYALIDSSNSNYNGLLEKGGKSPWGDRNLKGYVRVNVVEDKKGNLSTNFYVSLSDGIHGIYDDFADPKKATSLKRKDVVMDLNTYQNIYVDNVKEQIENIPFDGVSKTTVSLITNNSWDKVRFINRVKGNGDNIGDELIIDDQEFYVIGSDASTIKIMAKYNLYSGGYYDGTYHPYGSSATNIQNSEMRGLVNYKYPYNGVTYYADDSQKGKNYSDYKGSLVEKYVNIYENYLKTKGASFKESRIITVEELQKLGCDSKNGSKSCQNAPKWVYDSTYWTSTIFGSTALWYVHSNGDIHPHYYNDYTRGVRPVFVISKLDLD